MWCFRSLPSLVTSTLAIMRPSSGALRIQPLAPARSTLVRLTPRRLTAGTWAVGALVTAVIAFVPDVTFGFHSETGHLVLDSVDACVALLAAYLVYGRYLRYRRLQDLLLSQGLVMLALAGLVVTYVTEALTGSGPARIDVWLPLSVRIGGALVIVAAALAGERPAVDRPAARWLPLGSTVVAIVLLWLLRGTLPEALPQHAHPPSAQHPYFTGHWALLAAQAISAVCFLIGSIAFTRQAAQNNDQLLRWLGPGCALAGFARVNYLLYPSLYTDWLYAGDLLRTGCYLLLLIGASREIHQYWTAQATALLADERRRLAGELHDGVIQELTVIQNESFTLPDDDRTRQVLIGAAERALDEARSAVHTLTHPAHEPLQGLVRRAAEDAAYRHGVALEFTGDDSATARPDQHHALVRIVREAVSNAARHGRATSVSVELQRVSDRARLAVQDDGLGFDVAAAERGPGYGLTSMRERALNLPGSLDIASTPGQGSMVTVTWSLPTSGSES